MMRQQNQLVNKAFSTGRGKFVMPGRLAGKKALEMNTLWNVDRNRAVSTRSMKIVLYYLTIVLLCKFDTSSRAQDATSSVERTVKSASNKDTRIGLYLNVLPDCTSGPLPTIRLVSPPASGKVVVKSAKVKATNYKTCLALEVPAYAAFYKSQPDFIGDDVLTIEVKYEGGRTEVQKITVNVSGPGAQQKI